ncbi:MAG: hypothetical protein ACLPSH_09990 [Vulcanimicrobiaceae bacterium]
MDAPPSLDPQAPASAWPREPSLSLPWDVVNVRSAPEPTTLLLATDGRFLYVRFEAMQRGSIVATQHSNDTITGGSQSSNGSLSWSSDDAVWVDLWAHRPDRVRVSVRSESERFAQRELHRERRVRISLGIARRRS